MPSATRVPRASIVIPNWNGAHHLPTCLDALRRQTYTGFETILVDNGSTDDSLRLLNRDYPEVQVIALPSNRGYAGGCKAGIEAASGEVLVLLNNDTEATPTWLEALLKALDQHPEAGLVTP